ncbi:MAG TPA: DUF1592 domain-containing protein [Gemmataceae bacterium]|jgi:mono/diheme cytochrome c family protein|nr:DUF1592 domain-containing protein [Gemmataceae bacterium]
MGRRLTLVLLLLLPLGVQTRRPASGADDPKKPSGSAVTGTRDATFAGQIAPLLKTYCTRCHGGERPRAGMALDVYADDASAVKNPDVWDKVADKVRSGEMPPGRRRHPRPAEVAVLTGWIEAHIAKLDCTARRLPGRVTLRRLNRAQYNNTIRDLVGVDFHPAEDFPADDVGYGFDNIGDVLSMPPILLEKYLAAADKIVTRAFRDPDTRRRIMICAPTGKDQTECTRKILEHFAARAYRRPVAPAEVDRLVSLVELAEKQGDGFDKGIQVAVQAVLVSPHFLFLVERDRRQSDRAVHPVGDYELATRLSYFLWSSMPDDELFALARKGALRKHGNLEAQVRRMVKDYKSHALVDNFADQWLEVRNLQKVNPDPDHYPAFDEALRAAMRKETEMFFEAVMREDRSIMDFLDADYTFVNERLARHYGITGVKGTQFRRVKLTGGQRGGVLTQASVLTVTSNPTRTSPVKRGKWILDNILGTPPPPPPPDAGRLNEAKEAVLSGSLRQRMEQHRANPNCASCHQRMDPLGFGFENFDGIGAWRTRDGQFPVDPSGVLPGGQPFKGPSELKAILKKKEDKFRRCLAEKLLTFALGRGLESYDKCAVDRIAAALAKDHNRFSSLVIAVVNSDPFQMRGGRGGLK